MFVDKLVLNSVRCSQPAHYRCHCHCPCHLPPDKRYTDAETPSVASPDAPHFSCNVHSTDAFRLLLQTRRTVSVSGRYIINSQVSSDSLSL